MPSNEMLCLASLILRFFSANCCSGNSSGNVVDAKEGLPHDNISIKDDRAGAPEEEVTESEQQNRDPKSRQTTTEPLNEPLDPAVEVPQAGKSGEARKKDQQSNINWPAWQTISQGLLTFVMICVLSYHAILFTGQQHALQDQSKLLAQSVEQTKALISQQQEIEKPFIGIKRMELTKLTVGQLPTVTVTFFNGGRTSASQFKFTRMIYFTHEWDLESTIQGFIRKPINSFGGSFMPPGGEKAVEFRGNLPVRKDELTAMAAGQQSLVFEVFVSYIDDFGRDQHPKFCAVYNAKPKYKEFDECYEYQYSP